MLKKGDERLLNIAVSRNTLSDSVAEQIKELIVKKELKVGDELPSQRLLADQLKVGRPSIREALKKLQAIGIITIQQGRKSVVQSTDLKSLILNLSHVFELTDADLVYLIETKELIETNCAKLAAAHLTREEKKEIGELLDQMKNHLFEDEVFAEYDYLFHLKIVEASKNPILIVIFTILGNLIKKALEKTAEFHGGRGKALILHKSYYQALCNRESDQAVRFLQRIEKQTIREISDNEATRT